MISNLSIIIFLAALAVYMLYCIWCLHSDSLHIIHYLYLCMFSAYVVWILPLIIMSAVKPEDIGTLKLLDSITYIGAFMTPAFFFCICLAYVKGEVMFQRWMLLPFIVPVINLAVVFTDSLHHLQYEHFSVIRSEIVFGPYVYISGAYSYLCLVASIIILAFFAIRTNSRLSFIQTALLTGGALICLIASAAATLGLAGFEITATPVSFAIGIVMNGIAIYRMHLLDIRPASVDTILESISDNYIVLSKENIVVSYNMGFLENFGKRYGIGLGKSIDSCRNTGFLGAVKKSIEYSSPERKKSEGEAYHDSERDLWYSISISPVKIRNELQGYAVALKDVTELHRSLVQAAADREKLKEQEHLAFLGQMIGGLAHNLKSPIMGIAGCTREIEALNEEIDEGLERTDFDEADIREILSESGQWCQRIDEAAGYMSDIITVIKEQAVNAVNDDDATFTVEEVYRRCELLLKHELMKGRCVLKAEGDMCISIHGNLNCLVQAVANLISNAIYSQSRIGGGEIVFNAQKEKDSAVLRIIDRGEGISESVKEKLFKTMITTKGHMGTGLGLYISNSMIKSSFGGSMYVEDTEGGGATVAISIPMERTGKDEN